MKIKTIGVFTIGSSGWLHQKCKVLHIKCKAGSHDLEIRFESTDLADLKHAVNEMIQSELRDRVVKRQVDPEKCGCKTGANSRLDYNLDIANRKQYCLNCGDISDIN